MHALRVQIPQVLLLDRGTTHGILAHSDNDVGTLASLPSRVDADLLTEWQGCVSAPSSELLRRVRGLLPRSGVTDVSDRLRAELARTLREYYREDRARRMAGQAWMDMAWWATRRQPHRQ